MVLDNGYVATDKAGLFLPASVAYKVYAEQVVAAIDQRIDQALVQDQLEVMAALTDYRRTFDLR